MKLLIRMYDWALDNRRLILIRAKIDFGYLSYTQESIDLSDLLISLFSADNNNCH